MKLTYKNFEHRTKILDPFYRDPEAINKICYTPVNVSTLDHMTYELVTNILRTIFSGVSLFHY